MSSCYSWTMPSTAETEETMSALSQRKKRAAALQNRKEFRNNEVSVIQSVSSRAFPPRSSLLSRYIVAHSLSHSVMSRSPRAVSRSHHISRK
jgi:hypothetical protein